jgi:hypothetical protein
MSLILAKRLHFRRSGGRVKVAMSALASTLQEVIGNRSVEAVAQEWGVKAWRIRDILRGHTRAPRDPAELRAISIGSGIPYERLLLLAYDGNGHSRQTPPEGATPCPPERGRRSKDRSVSTS